MIEVKYYVTNDDNESDEFYKEEDVRVFVLTDEMILDLIVESGAIKRGEDVDKFDVGNHVYDKKGEE